MFKKFSPNLETNSYKEQVNSILCGYSFFQSLGLGSLSKNEAWKYYKQITPVFHGVNITAIEVSALKPVLWDKKKKEYIHEFDTRIPASAVLKLLENPNFDTTRKAFIEELVTSFVVTGDTFLVATGLNEKSPPSELFYVNPQFLNITAGSDGYTNMLSVNTANITIHYNKNGLDNLFFNKERTRQIGQIRSFNPDYSVNDLLGFSCLTPLYLEIEQYRQGNIHNYNLLKKGARPSGALKIKGSISDEVEEHLKTQVKQFNQGSENSGSVMVLTTGLEGEIDFQELSISNKDMDFKALKEMAREAIYQILKIPASFYSEKSSTFNNKGSDILNMYDFNVIPLAEMIYNELTLFLMPRYKDGDNYEITFIKNQIPAIREREVENADKLIATGLLTKDEGRKELGYEPTDDELYNPKATVKPAIEGEKNDKLSSDIPDRFCEQLKKNNFTDAEIKNAWSDIS